MAVMVRLHYTAPYLMCLERFVALFLRCVLFSMTLCVHVRASAEMTIDGDRLTVTTKALRIRFQGGEIVEITNRLTGVPIAYGTRRLPPVTGFLTSDDQAVPARSDGWRRGREGEDKPEAAQTVLKGPEYTAWLNVRIDRDTDDVVLGLWGESSGPAIAGLRLGLRNLDLSAGRLILPTADGATYSNTDSRIEARWTYPNAWLAGMLVWEGRDGGLVVYARDTTFTARAVQLRRREGYLDLGLETLASRRREGQTSVPYFEWRINAFRGAASVPISGYRGVLRFLWPRAVPPDPRLWAGQIARIVEVPSRANQAWLDHLPASEPPARTLLVLRDWADSGSPEYRMKDSAARFIGDAHSKGFYVMVPIAVQHAGAGWTGLTDVMRLRPISGGASESDPVPVHPGSAAWRKALILGLTRAFEGEKPDALLIDDASTVPLEADVGTGVSGLEGMTTLVRDLQSKFPDMVLGSNGLYETLLPYVRFAKGRPSPEQRTPSITDALYQDFVIWF